MRKLVNSKQADLLFALKQDFTKMAIIKAVTTLIISVKILQCAKTVLKKENLKRVGWTSFFDNFTKGPSSNYIFKNSILKVFQIVGRIFLLY